MRVQNKGSDVFRMVAIPKDSGNDHRLRCLQSFQKMENSHPFYDPSSSSLFLFGDNF